MFEKCTKPNIILHRLISLEHSKLFDNVSENIESINSNYLFCYDIR